MKKQGFYVRSSDRIRHPAAFDDSPQPTGKSLMYGLAVGIPSIVEALVVEDDLHLVTLRPR